MYYDKVNQKWDSSSKILKETVIYDGKTYFPEGDYKTMYGKNYWNFDFEYIFKKNFGNILEKSLVNRIGGDSKIKYQYDEKGYLSKIINYNNNNFVIETIEFINENGKLIERRRLILKFYSKYEYGNNNYIYKISNYDTSNTLNSYDEFKYDNNDYRIEMSVHFDNIMDYTYKYKYNNSGYLIEMTFPYNKYTYKYDSNNLLIEEYINNHILTSYKYDHNNYLIEILYYNRDDKLYCKDIIDNKYIIE
jgi:hypothetical protein